MAGVSRFEDLHAPKRAVDLRDEVLRLTETGPVLRDRGFRSQIRDAARSAPRNLSEGFDKFAPPSSVVAPTFIFYTIATSRGSDVLTRLLGPVFGGILGSDRLPTYLTYESGLRQLCWAHFTRNLLSAQDLATTAAATRFCREALGLQVQLFRLWHRFRGDPHARGAPLTRAQLIAKTFPIEKKFFALGERHVNAADRGVCNLARALFMHHQPLFTFVHEPGVEPTNNAAERARRSPALPRERPARGRRDTHENTTGGAGSIGAAGSESGPPRAARSAAA